jgi:GAF domain-containing protein
MKNNHYNGVPDPTFGVSALVVSSGQFVEVTDASKDPRFEVDQSTVNGKSTRNLMAAPISIGGEIVGVCTVINKRHNDGSAMAFAPTDRTLLELITSNTAIALLRGFQFEKALLERRKSAAMLSIIKARSAEAPLETVWKTTIDAIEMMVQPEVISIFLCDHNKREIFVIASKNDVKGLSLPFGKGIAATVAETAKPIRLQKAGKHPNFSAWVEEYTGINPQTVLCLPVKGFHHSGRTMAVIEIMNKQGGKFFLEEEKEALMVLCAELSLVLRRKAKEIIEIRQTQTGRQGDSEFVDVNGGENELEYSILFEHGADKKLSRVRRGSRPKTRVVNMDGGLSEVTTLVDESLEVSADYALDMIQSHDTDPFVLEDPVLIELVLKMVSSFGLLERFTIDEEDLREFITNVWMKYHAENAFHNFYHAWGVCHIAYTILRNGAAEYLTSLDILTVLLSAICHDIDHPGHSNAFEVATRSELAMLYSDDSVLERHHLAVTQRLLEDPSTKVLKNLTASEKAEFRAKMTSAILMTDMSQHFKLLDDILQRSTKPVPYDKDDPESRRLLMGHVLHTADLGAQTQAKELALKWSKKVIKEFMVQATAEVQLNLPITAMMHGLEDPVKQMKLQGSFISGIVIPLWSGMASCFKTLEYAVQQAEKNKQFYNDEVERLSNEKNLSRTQTPTSDKYLSRTQTPVPATIVTSSGDLSEGLRPNDLVIPDLDLPKIMSLQKEDSDELVSPGSPIPPKIISFER